MAISFTILSFLGPISLVVMVVFVAWVSRKLGVVLKRPPRYRWLYVSAMLVSLGIVFRLAGEMVTGRLDAQAALIYDIPIAVGLVMALIVTWHYWGWLLYERDSET